MPDWIEIPRWDEFQHYSNRDPIWIRNYVRQLNDPRYLQLTFAQRGLLHDLRLLYAMTRREIRLDTASMSRALNGRVFTAQLETLNHAGLLTLSASKPLAQKQKQKSDAYASDRADGASALPDFKQPENHLASTLLGEIRDADQRTAAVIHGFEKLLPDAAFAVTLERLKQRRRRRDQRPLQSEARFVTHILGELNRERNGR